jgi:alkylated DNA repair dioxygenase AlkB
VADEFRSWAGPSSDHPFEELLASARFEDLGTGRRGAVLVKVDDQSAVPLVRTTTQYRAPAQPFLAIHDRLADELRRAGSFAQPFNNALIEHYTPAYATMKRHSDQALDLAEDSSIAIYSCYRDPQRPSRQLVVRSKEPGAAPFAIPLPHGSVVAFSLATNRRFTHAIARCDGAATTDWLGITFRTAKTFVRFVDGRPSFANGAELTLATEAERRELFHLRRRENQEPSFVYPSIHYTISESDLLPPM